MTSYRGRFAPSPTGPLHIGSLTSALASYLDAKANRGQWLVRMEDLDPPREVPGAAQSILDSLQAHGLLWDEEVLWQSQRHVAYQQAIDLLLQSGKAFYCHCSRSDLQASNGIHNRPCRREPPTNYQDCAIRISIEPRHIAFSDHIQSRFSQYLPRDVGDFVLRRKDRLFAYQLAVVIDDAYQGITHCVRGSDLLDSTPRQIYLQQALGLPSLQYSHIPVITNQQQQKLSKQSHAKALDSRLSCDNLMLALQFLQQPLPPPALRRHQHDLLQWSIKYWSPARIPRQTAIRHDE